MKKVYRRLVRWVILTLSILLLLLLFLMFWSKAYVQGLSEELSSIRAEVIALTGDIQLLGAELAYLTTHSRLRRLVGSAPGMEYISPKNLLNMDSLYGE